MNDLKMNKMTSENKSYLCLVCAIAALGGFLITMKEPALRLLMPL